MNKPKKIKDLSLLEQAMFDMYDRLAAKMVVSLYRERDKAILEIMRPRVRSKSLKRKLK